MAGGIRRRKNVVVSRLKALISVIETFNKSDAVGNLGLISGTNWTTVRGSWGITSNKAVSGNSPLDYPLATLTFSKEDVTLSVDGVGPGVGTAFWVTDAGNWWASVVDGEQSCQTCYNAGTCQQFFNCCNGNYNPVVPGFTYTYCSTRNEVIAGFTYTYCSSRNEVIPGFTYTYCSSRNPDTPGFTYNYSYCTGYNTYGNIINFYVWYTCGGPGNSAPGSSCGLTYAQAQLCGGCKRQSYANYNNGSCANTAFASASNSTIPGNCSGTSTGTNPSTGGNCITFAQATNPSTGGNCATFAQATNSATGGNCNAFAFNCCYAYNAGNAFSCNCVINNKVRIIKSVANAVSTVATFSFNATIAGFRTILSGNNITVRAYSGSGYNSQIGSDQSTTISGYTKSKKHGIIKGPVTYAAAQSSEIDEFRVI